MYATKLCHKHVTLTDILAASRNIDSRDFSVKHIIPSTNILYNNSTDQVADINNVLLHDNYYQPLIYLDRVVKYIGDVGILVRMIGLHPIEFIELKNTLCQEQVLQSSWHSLYSSNDDVSLETKVITLRLIYSIMQICLKGIKLTNHNEYHIASDAAVRLCIICGWMIISVQTAESNMMLIESIINFAVKGLIPENIKIIVDKDKSDDGARYIRVPIHTIFTTIPDIRLLVNMRLYKSGGYRLIKFNYIRNFITVQLEPYNKINFNLDQAKRYKKYIQNKLSIIISSICHHQDLHNCILMDKKQTEYDVDTWSKHVINNLGNLYYKGDNCLNLKTIADNIELYNNLISLISADQFLVYMAQHEADFFYHLLNDGIQVLTEIEAIKNDMFIAFASAHMADILTRCGAVLTEDVFYTVFGIKPTHHHLKLLHRGILLRDNLMLYQQSIINPDNDNSNKSWVRQNPEEIRLSHQVALEVLCTYFQGLDKIVKIKPSAPKELIVGGFDLTYNNSKLSFTNEISLIEHPLPLRVSFTESIYKSTKVLLNLQKFLSEHKYIGIKGVQLSGPINLDLNSLAGDDLKIFQYFTGYDNVVDFKEWVNKLLTPPIKDNRLSTLLDLAETKDVQEQFILIMIAMSVSNRDFTLLRREPHQLIKKGFKQVLFPKFDSDIFDKLHDYAQLMSSFLQYDNREKEVSSEVEENLRNTYINIISDNDVLFEVNIKQCDKVGRNYNIVSDALLDNTKEMLLRDTPKKILDGENIQLIPHIIHTQILSRHRNNYHRDLSYTKFYKLSTHKTDISTTPNQQSSSSADTVTSSKRSSSYYPYMLASDTTLPKKSRVICASHISSADTVTISSTSCNSTQYNLSSKSLHTTISPVFERDKNDIVSLSSKPNNIISEESNNSNYNYMGEQSWLMSSERANKTSTTKYPQGYNYSTQAICQNPIVDDRYVNNHVPPNIYSPSTATNQTSNNFQTLVYNCQNPIVDDRYVNNHVPPNIYSPSTATNQTSNNFQTLVYNCQNPIVDDRYVNNQPPNIYSPSTATNQTSNNFQALVYNCQNENHTSSTADSMKDDWWTDLCMLQDDWLQHTLCDQNDSDSLTEDRMQKNYKFKLPLYDYTTLSKEPMKEDRVNTYHVSSAEAVTISSQSLYTTSSPIPPIFERDKNEIVSLASKSNNITSEGSNNSNYMREQSWLMSSEGANNTCTTTEYQHGYDCSTQNPIVDDRYVNNHVPPNIYSPSTATNTRSNNFQTEVYNCKNGSNTPSPAGSMQDDLWKALFTLQDN